jgi:hypothetical protein
LEGFLAAPFDVPLVGSLGKGVLFFRW